MINPIDIQKDEEGGVEISIDYDIVQTESAYAPSNFDDYEETRKPKARRKKKSMDDSNVILADETSSRELNYMESNKPFRESFAEGENLLRGSIAQIDGLQQSITDELVSIRASKTLKRKYDYITNLSGSSSALISTKIGAIKELNKIVADSHNLEMKRAKEQMASAAGQKDENKMVMDMYNAFISTPMSSNAGNFQPAPSIQDITFSGIAGSNAQQFGMSIPVDGQPIQQAPLTNAQNMMRLEHNPDIEEVVVHDARSGNTWFDVINTKTGESIEHVDRPDPMFLEDTKLDIRNKVARNTNLDTTYKLIVINERDLLEY